VLRLGDQARAQALANQLGHRFLAAKQARPSEQLELFDR
jgi:hypothetical protein